MFDDALLESSPACMPVLRARHWVVALATGTSSFLGALLLLPWLVITAKTSALVVPAVILGVFSTCYVLALCYVWVDATRRGLQRGMWCALTLALNLPGFLVYLFYSGVKTGNWRRAAMPLAYLGEGILVGVLILVPLVYTEALPKSFLIEVLTSPLPPPPPGPPVRASAPGRKVPHVVLDPMTTPVNIPQGITPLTEQPPLPEGAANPGPWVPGGIPPEGQGGFPPGVVGSVPWGTTPPPPPSPRPARPQIVRVGGQVIAAKLIYGPKPAYPELARRAHVQGTVLLQAIIGRGRNRPGAEVLSGHPWLVRAALDAVKQWRYQPTLLNGEPVEVLTEISASFVLAE